MLRQLILLFALLLLGLAVAWMGGLFTPPPEDISLRGLRPPGIGGALVVPGRGIFVLPGLIASASGRIAAKELDQQLLGTNEQEVQGKLARSHDLEKDVGDGRIWRVWCNAVEIPASMADFPTAHLLLVLGPVDGQLRVQGVLTWKTQLNW